MTVSNKKKIIKSLENLSEDLRELMHQQHPTGYQGSITRIRNAKNEPIFVFPLETEDAIYLVKVPATKNSDGEYAVESGKKQEFDAADDDGLPVSGDDDFEAKGESDDYDEEGGDGRSKDPSYEPDFDD
jgi:hypothetical protein